MPRLSRDDALISLFIGADALPTTPARGEAVAERRASDDLQRVRKLLGEAIAAPGSVRINRSATFSRRPPRRMKVT